MLKRQSLYSTKKRQKENKEYKVKEGQDSSFYVLDLWEIHWNFSKRVGLSLTTLTPYFKIPDYKLHWKYEDVLYVFVTT